jgi:hypothetical protein
MAQILSSATSSRVEQFTPPIPISVQVSSKGFFGVSDLNGVQLPMEEFAVLMDIVQKAFVVVSKVGADSVAPLQFVRKCVKMTEFVINQIIVHVPTASKANIANLSQSVPNLFQMLLSVTVLSAVMAQPSTAFVG